MKNGIGRFDHYLDLLQVLLDKAAKQKNPALWLYQNNARTPLFMLEALAKLYAGIHNKKKFCKLKEQFKVLEDMLGAIDYYDCFAKEFAANKQIPATLATYIQAQSREKIQSLNETLKEKEWIAEGKNRVEKIRKNLSKADWQKEKEETESIYNFYVLAIKEMLNFINQKNFHFENVEADVHELRRKLRWLSIYPQALRGCIQVSKAKTTPKYLAKYLTKEITGSAYNIMPDAADHKHFLLLEKNRFYAMSWMIAGLGKLKDNGLRVVVVEEALLQTTNAKEKEALKKAYQLLGTGQSTLQQLLDKAEGLCKVYFKEKNLEQLVAGTATIYQK
ncbi:MAG TPA: hypothetical protein VK484_05245 [Ferruginibacter sp.]|nr:hypothetical protein [Ferruginibacter sp.]